MTDLDRPPSVRGLQQLCCFVHIAVWIQLSRRKSQRVPIVVLGDITDFDFVFESFENFNE